MIITFFRSSSYGCYSMCQHQYWLTYTLGLGPDQKNGWAIPTTQYKADRGTLVHKALELLASKKLALQEGKDEFDNDELNTSFPAKAFTPDDAIETAWAHYKNALPHWEWSIKEYRECRRWFFAALEFNGGRFNPLNREVIWPEKQFDFPIVKDWARYCYSDADGNKLQGHLGLKGTLDLICWSEVPGVVELVDWKTGQRKNWVSGEKKGYRELKNDPQFRLYHYALCHLLPDAQEIFVTVVYVRDGGPFTIHFSRDDLPGTEEMLKQRFDEIRANTRPALIWSQPKERYKCKWCPFGINNWEDTDKLACHHLRDELVKLGMDRATQKYGKTNAFLKYGGGGGSTKERPITNHDEKKG